MLYIVYLKCVVISHIKKSLNMLFLWPSVYEAAAITSLSLLCEHCGDYTTFSCDFFHPNPNHSTPQTQILPPK